jgi:hypothetical protein
LERGDGFFDLGGIKPVDGLAQAGRRSIGSVKNRDREKGEKEMLHFGKESHRHGEHKGIASLKAARRNRTRLAGPFVHRHEKAWFIEFLVYLGRHARHG